MATPASQTAGHPASGVQSLPGKPPPSRVPAREEPRQHGATEVYDHKSLEADIREERMEYIEKRAARAPIEELIRMLEKLMSDTQGCIHSREEENRVLGDTNGPQQHEQHEKRIQVLDANIAQYRLERMHLAQLAQLGGRAVPWNNGTGSWGQIHGEVFSDKDMIMSE